MTAQRLAMVVPDLAIGGLQGMACGLALALDRSEFEPVFYTFDAEGPNKTQLEEAGIECNHHPREQGVDAAYARKLAEHFVEDRIDLVHCHNVTALFHGARAAWRAQRLPSLFTEHDREMPAPWRHRVLHRWLGRRVTRTVAVSEQLRRDLVRYEGFPPDSTGCLVNGIPDPMERFSGDRAEARAELGWSDIPVVLAVGSCTPVKNHAGFLRVFADLHARMDGQVRFVLAGDGPLRDDLEEQAHKDLPAGAVVFLGNRDDVPRLLAASDVFVLPSHREGLPLSLVEAHAMARPSVASLVGGNPEVIQDGVTGTLVECRDNKGFADALESILQDPDEQRERGRLGRRRFLDVFTHERMVSAYVALYEALLPVRAV
jgi:glycosyltransferase involved in cell wall biosynthesis